LSIFNPRVQTGYLNWSPSLILQQATQFEQSVRTKTHIKSSFYSSTEGTL